MSDTTNKTNVTAPAPTADDSKKSQTPDGGCCTAPPGGGDPGPST
jgi:hypothetical protein